MSKEGKRGLSLDQLRHEIESLPGIITTRRKDDLFFFYDPDNVGELSWILPVATIVCSDEYDAFSNLDRSNIFRLNIGIDKDSFLNLFGSKARCLNYDFTELNVIMPHPVYGRSYYICILNPGDELLSKLRELLHIAHLVAARRFKHR